MPNDIRVAVRRSARVTGMAQGSGRWHAGAILGMGEHERTEEGELYAIAMPNCTAPK